MHHNQIATLSARRSVMHAAAAKCGGSLVQHDGFSVFLHGWKDYYLKALPSAPTVCQLCADGQGRFVFSDIRKGYASAPGVAPFLS